MYLTNYVEPKSEVLNPIIRKVNNMLTTKDWISMNIQGILNCWKSKYIEDCQTNERFENLRLNHAPHRTLVTRVLTEDDTNQVNVLHALLLITYRLRNNLFDGLKA